MPEVERWPRWPAVWASRGRTLFDVQVRKLAGHDLAHLEQLERAARARTA